MSLFTLVMFFMVIWLCIDLKVFKSKSLVLLLFPVSIYVHMYLHRRNRTFLVGKHLCLCRIWKLFAIKIFFFILNVKKFSLSSASFYCCSTRVALNAITELALFSFFSSVKTNQGFLPLFEGCSRGLRTLFM
jgi:hypothetical protein